MMKKLTGRIVRSLSGFYEVQTPEGSITCRGRGSLRRSGDSPLTGDRVEISRSEHTTKLVRLSERSFYQIIRQKLGGFAP